VKHLGILATTSEGAALCFRVFCQQGAGALGPHEHPDVTLDCIALARSLSAWERGVSSHHSPAIGAAGKERRCSRWRS
jgi:aspartate racemase